MAAQLSWGLLQDGYIPNARTAPGMVYHYPHEQSGMLGSGEEQSQSRNDPGHGHTHGALDRAVLNSERGIWVTKISLAVLIATAAMQVVLVVITGSVSLLADTIHNFSDAATALPLWAAFTLSRR